jgi:hypothetical protein
MAKKVFIEVPPSPGSQTRRHFFTINETRVGVGGDNNKRSDIQLIQFFLRKFFGRHPELFRRLPRTSNSPGQVAIDGLVGAQTKTGILLFQQHEGRAGSGLVQDGLVSVAQSFVSPISQKRFTIILLNLWFEQHSGEAEFLTKLESHPDIIRFAPELQAELSAGSVNNL